MPTNYPLDYTGSSTTNQVTNENITLTTNTKYRVFAPINGPYFFNTIKIKDVATGNFLTPSQWAPFFLVQAATVKTGLAGSVYATVIIKDSTVSNNLSISYQSIGGNYIGDYSNIIDLLNIALNDTRSVNWDNITNHIMSYNAAIHTHSLSNISDVEILTLIIEKLCNAIILGDTIAQDSTCAYVDAIVNKYATILNNLSTAGTPLGDHINNSNAHNYTKENFGLGNVQNYPVASDNDALLGTNTVSYVLLSTAKNIINNALNGGLDAHILDTNNPHGLSPMQINLGNVKNYGVATLADINTPDVNNPKYVTSDILYGWLTSYLNTKNAQYANDITTINGTITSAINTSNANLITAQNLLSNITNLLNNYISLNSKCNDVAAEIQALSDNASNQQTAAQTLVQSYLTSALAAAQSTYYAAGYQAGLTAN